MIGRERETKRLRNLYHSESAELVAVYGRRRVGKTYLIRETFKNNLSFQHTGINNENLDEQLLAFSNSMRRYGRRGKTVPKNWTEAFFMLQQLLEKTKAVSNGHLDVDIAHTKRTDVIGGLQNSFATMLESLNYYINSVRTATDQTKRYNRELEHTTQLAVEAQHQKTVFIQNVTHQIRTPLNIIMGFAQILNCPTDDTSLSEELGQDEIKSIASTMTHNSRLLIRMVMMLFDSSENGKAETANCDKREMVACNDVCQVALKFTTKNHPDIPVEYKTELADDFCIHTNFRYLEYSLEELLSNAVRYSDQQHISLHVTRNEEFVRFVVQDTGNGIAEADRDNIFKFFTKVDDFSEGLGLGLPLTKRHAETLGGNLILDTTYHEGSRFIFEIPVA